MTDTTKCPRWKPVPLPTLCEVFEVSTDGRVRRIDPSGINQPREKATSVRGRYPTIGLQHCGVKASMRLHQLVMLTFVGPANGRWVNHIDGNKCNCSLDNLEYVTPSGNSMHAYLSAATNAWRNARKC